MWNARGTYTNLWGLGEWFLQEVLGIQHTKQTWSCCSADEIFAIVGIEFLVSGMLSYTTPLFGLVWLYFLEKFCYFTAHVRYHFMLSLDFNILIEHERERTSLLGQTKVFHLCFWGFGGFLGMWRQTFVSLLSLVCLFWLVGQGYFLGNLRIFVRKILNCPEIWAPGFLVQALIGFCIFFMLFLHLTSLRIERWHCIDVCWVFWMLPLHWRHIYSIPFPLASPVSSHSVSTVSLLSDFFPTLPPWFVS